MIERVVESWLTKVNEHGIYGMEIPFCQLLASQGYQVVHITRHGNLEEGKDVLAIAPDGTPCAYQLKDAPTGVFTLKSWANHVDQVTRLLEIPIKHPSIDGAKQHRAILVVNGKLDEEVRLEISHRNDAAARRMVPELETIVRGELLAGFIKLHTNLWPTQLTHEKELVELFLADGSGYLDKPKLAGLLLSLLPIGTEAKADSKAPKGLDVGRALASAALCTSYALSPYEQSSNHVAVIEGWTVYLAHLIALAEKYQLKKEHWRESFEIAVFAIEQAFEDLWAEVSTSRHFVIGDPLVDAPFYRGRLTWMLGLVSTYGLWKSFRGGTSRADKDIADFVGKHKDRILLWGEAAVPQFLAMYWLMRRSDPTPAPDFFLIMTMQAICHLNGSEGNGLPDPYHDFPHVMTDIIEQLVTRTPTTPKETYKGVSYVMDGLVHLLVRTGWKQQLRFLWPDISYLTFAEFRAPSAWESCLWQLSSGHTHELMPDRTQSWSQLVRDSQQVSTTLIPQLFQERPELLLLFALVYPHRFTKDVMKFLDAHVRKR